MNGKPFFLLSAIVLVLGGCALAPKYSRPEAPVPVEWPSGPAYGESGVVNGTVAAAEIPWREFFPDERVQRLIDDALKNNRDLRLAALNVERARGLYGIQRAELWPTIDAAGRWFKERVPAELSTTRRRMTVEQYSADAGIFSW